MKPPLFVRPLSEPERAALREGLRGQGAFTLRRCQVLLASDQGRWPSDIAAARSEEHTSELQSLTNLVCRLLLEKKKHIQSPYTQRIFRLDSESEIPIRERLPGRADELAACLALPNTLPPPDTPLHITPDAVRPI